MNVVHVRKKMDLLKAHHIISNAPLWVRGLKTPQQGQSKQKRRSIDYSPYPIIDSIFFFPKCFTKFAFLVSCCKPQLIHPTNIINTLIKFLNPTERTEIPDVRLDGVQIFLVSKCDGNTEYIFSYVEESTKQEQLHPHNIHLRPNDSCNSKWWILFIDSFILKLMHVHAHFENM